MKKRFISVLSLLLAFVLCFALAACGGKTNKNADPDLYPGFDPDLYPGLDPSKPASDIVVSLKLMQAAQSITALAAADGFKANVDVSFDTANRDAFALVTDVEKRGDTVAADVGNATYYYNAVNGYVFAPGSAAAYKAFGFPAVSDIIAYATYIAASQKVEPVPGDEPAPGPAVSADIASGASGINYAQILAKVVEYFDYDAETKTLTGTLDLAEQYNKYLTPLYNAYSRNSNLRKLADDYIRLASDNKANFDSVTTLVTTMLLGYQQNTLAELFEYIKDATDIDVYNVLASLGYEFSEEDKAQLNERNAGDAIVALRDYLEPIVAQLIPSVSTSAAEDGAAEQPAASELKNVLAGAIEAMLYTEVEGNDLQKVEAAVLQLVDWVEAGMLITHTKQIVDSRLANVPYVYDMIVNAVEFKTLYAKLVFKFDATGTTVTEYAASGEISHSYKGAAKPNKLLADNDYKFSVKLVPGEILTDPEPFDITYFASELYKLVYGDYMNGFTVTIGNDLSGEPLNINNIVYRAPGKILSVSTIGGVTYNSKTHELTFGAELLAELAAASPYVEVSIDGTRGVTVGLVFLPDDADGLVKMLTDLGKSFGEQDRDKADAAE